MEPTTAEKEDEALKSMATDAAAMDKLLGELDEPSPPATDDEPPAPPAPKEPQKHEEPKPPAEPPPPAETPPPTAELDDFEKELESDKFELPAGATNKAREVNKAVKHTARAEHTARRSAETARVAAEKERDDLKAKMASYTQDREELDRLRPIVETFAIERDPQLNARFTRGMQDIDQRIMHSLLNAELEEATAKYIMEHGGPSHFSKDSVSQVTAEPEFKGGENVQMSHKQFWDERVVKQLSGRSKDAIRLAFDDEVRLREGRDAELRSKLSNRQQYFKDLEEQSKKNEETFKGRCKIALENQLKDLGDLVKEKTIPADATPELKQRLESYNKVVQEATAKFDESFLDTSPEVLVEKNLGRLILKNVKAVIALKDEEIAAERAAKEAIQKKWDASKKAASTSHRQSVQQQAKPLEGVFEKNDGVRMEKMMEQLP
jgi:hypothetical protein